MSSQKKLTQATNLQMVEVDHNQFAVEMKNDNVNVNLTQMAKPFGKKVSHWLSTDDCKFYLSAVSDAVKTASADLLEIRRGGNPKVQGTWAKDRRIAIRFAQWLDPVFAVKVDELILKVLSGDAIIAEPLGGVWPIIRNGVVGYPRIEILKVAGYTADTSSSITSFKKKYPNDHFRICNVACFSPRLAKLRLDMGQMRKRRLEFDKTAPKKTKEIQ